MLFCSKVDFLQSFHWRYCLVQDIRCTNNLTNHDPTKRRLDNLRNEMGMDVMWHTSKERWFKFNLCTVFAVSTNNEYFFQHSICLFMPSVLLFTTFWITLRFHFLTFPSNSTLTSTKKLLMRNHILHFSKTNAAKLHSMRTIIVSIEFTTVEHKWMESWNLGGLMPEVVFTQSDRLFFSWLQSWLSWVTSLGGKQWSIEDWVFWHCYFRLCKPVIACVWTIWQMIRSNWPNYLSLSDHRSISTSDCEIKWLEWPYTDPLMHLPPQYSLTHETSLTMFYSS